jgi:hypothetical protein
MLLAIVVASGCVDQFGSITFKIDEWGTKE